MKQMTIALVGQPNVGKSMLINSLSDAKLHVGNFTGVTVEKKEIELEYNGYQLKIVDLPGTYALNDYSIEERVTNQFLHEASYDLILNVVDSTNLEKNLQLSAELMGFGKRMVMALNMVDEANKEGIEINAPYLSTLLGFPAVLVSAADKIGLDALLEAVVSVYESESFETKLTFSEPVESELALIEQSLKKSGFQHSMGARSLAINLLKHEKSTYKILHDEPVWLRLQPILEEATEHLLIHHDTDDLREAFIEEYSAFNRGIVAEVVKHRRAPRLHLRLTERIDDILIHPIFGIPIFLFFMWSLFQLTFELGTIPMDWIDALFQWLSGVVGENIASDEVRSLVVDGIIAGVGAVVLFVPNIVILFIGIALLESTGYMSRVAFLLDGFFHKFGLHGQSFIPLVTGFGCSIPAYMSARILKNDKDRLITLFVIGFMSCGARLPVYVLFAGAFFSESQAGNILFLIYISGALIGLFAAKLLKMTAFKGVDEPFVMEMPKYRLPSLKLIWHTVQTKTVMYLKKAGTFIAIASMLVWFLSSYPKDSALQLSFDQKIEQATSPTAKQRLANQYQEVQLEQSYLGQIGHLIAPLFAPLGFDWKMAVALQTGLAAKEVVVSTLGVLYSLGDSVDQENEDLKSVISSSITLPAALAFIVVIMTYLPCLAASVVFTKEAGGIRYFFYLLFFTSVIAYTLAWITYRVASLLFTV